MKNIIIVIFLIVIASVGIAFAVTNNKTTKSEVNMDKKVLVAYFSKAGEQYSVGNITKGNTKIIAEMIAENTNGDLFEIKEAKDVYPKDYTELTEYSKKEMQENARPEIIGKVENFDQYDTIFIGFPIWWGDKPMPVYTFIESYDFNGKTIVPFCTHEGSGFTGTQGMDKTGAKILSGLAVYGYVAQREQDKARKQVKDWLSKIGY